MRAPSIWFRGLMLVILCGCEGSIEPYRDPNAPGAPGAGPFGGSGGPASGPGAGPAANLPPGAVNPGRVTAHRLNRVEYDNTIRDLFGFDSKPSSQFGFPEDNYVEGFDNNAQSLSA